ncbi:MAG: hypothetical protein NVV57_09685 [Demequina sp.]|nr:hypothetical protein [Demequina sp.]
MTLRHRASYSLAPRLSALLAIAAVALASVLVSAAPADAAGTRVISGTFSIPTSGVQSFWAETVSVTLYTESGDYYTSASLNTSAKTFSISGVDNGKYRLKFEASFLCGEDAGCRSANLLSGYYGGGNGTLIDVTSANKTGLTYAYAAGRTISGTISLGSGGECRVEERAVRNGLHSRARRL